MNIDLTGISDHVDTVFYDPTAVSGGSTNLILAIGIIIVSTLICLFSAALLDEIPKFSFFGIALVIITGITLFVNPSIIVSKKSINTVSLTHSGSFTTAKKVSELNMDDVKFKNSNSPTEFNNAIERHYNLRAVDNNKIPISVYDENVVDEAVNNGVDYTLNGNKVKCDFSYDVLSKNNVRQPTKLKMDKVVCYNNGSVDVINGK